MEDFNVVLPPQVDLQKLVAFQKNTLYNPLLVNLSQIDDNNIDITNYSFEYKKERYQVKEVLQLDKRNKYKIKLLKAGVKTWKNDYLEKEKATMQVIKNVSVAVTDSKQKLNSLWQFFIYLTLFLLMIIINFNYDVFTKTPSIYKLLISINENINNDRILSIVATSLTAALFLNLISMVYNSKTVNYYNKEYNVNKRKLNTLSRKVKTTSKAALKKIEINLISLVKNQKTMPLLINKVVKKEYQLDNIEQMINTNIEKVSDLKKITKATKIKKALLKLVTIGLGISYIVLQIVEFIQNK